MAIVTVAPKRNTFRSRLAPVQPFGVQSLWTPRVKAKTSRYSLAERDDRQPSLDPYAVPTGNMQGLGDLAGSTGTGIAFVDDTLGKLVSDVRDAAFATKITMYCSIAAGIGTVLLFFRTSR